MLMLFCMPCWASFLPLFNDGDAEEVVSKWEDCRGWWEWTGSNSTSDDDDEVDEDDEEDEENDEDPIKSRKYAMVSMVSCWY